MSTIESGATEIEFYRKQRGWWDDTIAREKLLCGECEGVLSRYETVARFVLFGNKPPQKVIKGRLGIIDPSFVQSNSRAGPMEVRLVATGDYISFKKFELSLLWRAAIASNCFYRFARLPAVDEESIRCCLVGESTPSADFFGCQLLDLYLPDIDMTKSIETPRSTRDRQKHQVTLFIAGYAWSFCISPKNVPDSISKYYLRVDGTLPVQRIDATPMKNWWQKQSLIRRGQK